MESATTILDSCASTFSQCGMCTKKEQLRIGVLIISFILGTVDMVTDWINYIQWSSVGGYDQYYFAFIFQTTFLCAAVAGSILWAIEVLLMIHRSRVFLQRRLERSKTEPMPNGGITNESKMELIVEKIGINRQTIDRTYGRSTSGSFTALRSVLAFLWSTCKAEEFFPYNHSYYCILNVKLNVDNVYSLLGIVWMQ